jgi:hypothetical protein
MLLPAPCLATQLGAVRRPHSQHRRVRHCNSASRLVQAAQSARSSTAEATQSDQVYENWLALPIQPGRVRRTVCRPAGPGVWLFEQSQGVLDVLVNIRMTVVKLRDGSLFVHAPVAPTAECLSLLRGLGAPVRYVVLPTSAVEHKARPYQRRLPAYPCSSLSRSPQVFLGPFAKCFPEAQARREAAQSAPPVPCAL